MRHSNPIERIGRQFGSRSIEAVISATPNVANYIEPAIAMAFPGSRRSGGQFHLPSVTATSLMKVLTDIDDASARRLDIVVEEMDDRYSIRITSRGAIPQVIESPEEYRHRVQGLYQTLRRREVEREAEREEKQIERDTREQERQALEKERLRQGIYESLEEKLRGQVRQVRRWSDVTEGRHRPSRHELPKIEEGVRAVIRRRVLPKVRAVASRYGNPDRLAVVTVVEGYVGLNRMGQYVRSKKRIELNLSWLQIESTYEEVLLHEWGHAIVDIYLPPVHRPHGPEWKEVAVALGVNPRPYSRKRDWRQEVIVHPKTGQRSRSNPNDVVTEAEAWFDNPGGDESDVVGPSEAWFP